MRRSVSPAEVGGALRAPSSKSSMQRAVACAALAPGLSTLGNAGFGADCLAALALVEALGAKVERRENSVLIEGGILEKRPGGPLGAPGGIDAEPRRLSCGESGLCIRMFSPILALLPGEILLEAEGSLRSRPLSMVEGALESIGGLCSSTKGFPPIRVRGPLRGGKLRTDARSSSQFVTGLLIALPLAPADSLIEAEGLVSGGYVDLTIDTMRAFGVEVAKRDSAEGTGAFFDIQGRQSYRAADFVVEGDWSGAAFLLVAGAVAARDEPLEVSGLSPNSSQPDRAVLDALAAAGAEVEWKGGSVLVRRDRLEPFFFDARDCPDLVPPLVALASFCSGTSRIAGASRLRAKESDRARALCEEFGKLGIGVAVEGDEMAVTGGRPAGGLVEAHGDHRIAMAAAVVGLAAPGGVRIDGAECVSKSWPRFFEDIASIRR
ncbi:MAG: 3-phosphoshikimate 1-carboxyvinyltransferase [Rectinemataceae bacterium]